MKLMDLLSEAERKFEYGCVMLFFKFPEMKKIQDMIDPNDLYEEEGDDSFGFDDEPHTTLLFGLHKEVTTEEVENILDEFTYDTVKAHNPSLFKNEKYDVLKFDIDGDNLHETNKKLKEFPHTSDFPNYRPHMTICYLKRGLGEKYVNKLKKFKHFWLNPQHAVFSKSDGTKNKISINVD